MRKTAFFLLLVLAPSMAWAIEPKVFATAPARVAKNSLVTIRLTGTVSDTPVILEVAKRPSISEGQKVEFYVLGPAKKPAYALVVFPTEGTYTYAVVASGKVEGEDGKKVESRAYGFLKTTVGKEPPVIDPDIDVDPDVDPTPQPTPDPVPVPEPGDRRVLMLWESSQGLSREQANVWYSTWLKEYLDTATVKDSKGGKGYRIWDVDTQITNEAPEWAGMLASAKSELAKPGATKLPALVVFNGTKGKAYPFPSSNIAVMEALKK